MTNKTIYRIDVRLRKFGKWYARCERDTESEAINELELCKHLFLGVRIVELKTIVTGKVIKEIN